MTPAELIAAVLDLTLAQCGDTRDPSKCFAAANGEAGVATDSAFVAWWHTGERFGMDHPNAERVVRLIPEWVHESDRASHAGRFAPVPDLGGPPAFGWQVCERCDATGDPPALCTRPECRSGRVLTDHGIAIDDLSPSSVIPLRLAGENHGPAFRRRYIRLASAMGIETVAPASSDEAEAGGVFVGHSREWAAGSSSGFGVAIAPLWRGSRIVRQAWKAAEGGVA